MTNENDNDTAQADVDRAAAKAEIDAMLASTPPGSPGYGDPEFQRQLQALHGRAYGDVPVTHDDTPGEDGAGTKPKAGEEAAEQRPVDYNDPGSVAEMLMNLPAAQGEAARQMIEQLGGPDSEAFRETVHHATNAIDTIAAGNPWIKDLMNTPIDLRDGKTAYLGDDPVVIALAAAIGRTMNPAAPPPPQDVHGDVPAHTISEADRARVEDELAELNAKVPPGTPAYTSARHQAKISKLYDQLYGGAPIVGRGGRIL